MRVGHRAVQAPFRARRVSQVCTLPPLLPRGEAGREFLCGPRTAPGGRIVVRARPCPHDDLPLSWAPLFTANRGDHVPPKNVWEAWSSPCTCIFTWQLEYSSQAHKATRLSPGSRPRSRPRPGCRGPCSSTPSVPTPAKALRRRHPPISPTRAHVLCPTFVTRYPVSEVCGVVVCTSSSLSVSPP